MLVTDLTIFNSRGFPVFGKRRIVYDMLELFSVLHFRDYKIVSTDGRMPDRWMIAHELALEYTCG
jgi:hypothetical protein